MTHRRDDNQFGTFNPLVLLLALLGFCAGGIYIVLWMVQRGWID
jgi:hypothetical protein